MKLEDLPKKQVFNAPDGYFDNLPQRIQQRIAESTPRRTAWYFQYKLQYALPVIMLTILGIWMMPESKNSSDIEAMLASVETQEILNYLDQSDLTTEELLQDGLFSNEDAESIESEVYQLEVEDAMIDQILDEIEIENL